MWGLGDYPAVADTVIPDLGAVLVDACRVAAPDQVLDVAAGAGNASLPAARRGAAVTATDLSDVLLAECARRATAAGLDLTCREADAEALPFADASFDVVLSCVGVMFAPNHRAAADELVRVLRPGGRLGVLSWTPTGFIGQLFAAMKPFVPAPPPGAQPPPLWGDPTHVAALLDDRIDLTTATGRVRVTAFARPEEFRVFFRDHYGPTCAAYRGLAGDPARTAELDAAIDGLARSAQDAAGAMEWEYLLVTGTRR